MVRINRRRLLKSAAVAAAIELGPQMADPWPVHTKFAALPDQQAKIMAAAAGKRGAWLVGAGMSSRSGRDMASVLQDAMQAALPDRPIFYVDYGNRSHDPEGYAGRLAKLQRMFGRVAYLGQSMAPLMLGSAAAHMDEELRLDVVLADCTPRSDETTRFAWAHSMRGLLVPSWYPGGTLGTVIADGMTFGLRRGWRFPHNSAHSALTHNQLEALLNGDRHIRSLRQAVGSEAIFFARLSPADSGKDHLVNPEKSIAAFRQDFPELIEAPVGGIRQAHSNPWSNHDEYAHAIAALPWQDIR